MTVGYRRNQKSSKYKHLPASKKRKSFPNPGNAFTLSAMARNYSTSENATGPRIRKLLESGKFILDVAAEIGCSRRWVYDYASRNNLPYNPPIREGSPNEQRILRALIATDMNVDAVARLYSQSPSNIKTLIKRVKNAA